MKQKIQLQIPTPCHENWENMNASQQGRFCMSCRKEVVDFTVMTDQEMLAYITTASGNTCGRAENSQLNRFMAIPDQKSRYSFKYVWSLLITSALISGKSSAQVKPPKETVVALGGDSRTMGDSIITVGKMMAVDNRKIPLVQITGRVADEQNNPIPYASVVVKGSSKGVATDAGGNFSIQTKDNVHGIELVISSVGYISQTIACSNPRTLQSVSVENNIIRVKVEMVLLKTAMMGEVVVTNRQLCTRRTTGMMLYTVSESNIRKTTDTLKDVFGINEIKAYPNPIAVNGVFNLRFKIKTAGDYTIQFTDASGKILANSQLTISSGNQLEPFNAGMLGAAGIYFASITHKKTMKTFTTRLLVQ